MNKNISIFYCGAAIIVMLLFSFNDKSSATAKINSWQLPGDTISFAPNTAGGWSILSSYLNQDTPDSVQFEIILKRSRIDGKTDQLIGTITNPIFIPAKNQKADYYLLGDNVWDVRITKDGECYLKQNRGSSLKPSSLAGNPDVIPINVRYKNN